MIKLIPKCKDNSANSFGQLPIDNVQESIDNYYQENKHKTYSHRRDSKSTDCSGFALGVLNNLGSGYSLTKAYPSNSCEAMLHSNDFESVDYTNEDNIRPGDLAIYGDPNQKHVVVIGGKGQNGWDGYESATNSFQRDGKTRNGVQKLSGVTFSNPNYGWGTSREGQEAVRTKPSSLKLIKVLRAKKPFNTQNYYPKVVQPKLEPIPMQRITTAPQINAPEFITLNNK